jgi:molybdopterin adenylyltransferase
VTADAPDSSPFRAAVLVVSDRVAAGTHTDTGGARAAEMLRGWGIAVARVDVVADDRSAIGGRLREYADRDRVDLVVTTGGTGFAPRDLTPEATRDAIEREAPGIAEHLRRESAARTPFAVLSRGVAGIRGATLIVNLPGNPRGVEECLTAFRPLLDHALGVLRGGAAGHPPHREAR